MTTEIITNDFQRKRLTRSLMFALNRRTVLSFKSEEKRGGGFQLLKQNTLLTQLEPFIEEDNQVDQPKRKSLKAPFDNGTFVKPIKQCFVKNPRLMPMTRLMLTLLAGWLGKGRAINTTIATIAKELRRSPRMVWNYLQDAVEEGYLKYSKNKNRIGAYTGIRIYLNFAAIRFQTIKSNSKNKEAKTAKIVANPDMKHSADNNYNPIISKNIDEQLLERMLQLGTCMGYFEKKRMDL